jgi:ABC-type glycerol-3-phosphate transport system permease component
MTSAAQTASLIRRISRSEKYTAGRVIPEVLKYAIVVSLALSYAFPLYWMISSALKTDPQVYRIPPVLVPNPAQWVNFINAWKSDNFSLYTFNSIFRYALPYTLFTLLSSSIVAYGFSRIRWLGRDKLFYLCIGTMLIPYTVTMVPLFIIFKQLKWTGTYLPMIVPALFGNAFFIFMLRQFFRVILPLAKPALAVVALFAFMGTWNDYLGPLIYINKYQMFPLALGIQKLRNMMSQVGNAPLAYPYLMAVSTIAAAPIIIIFFFAQRTFIEGIALTGLKG